MRLLRELVRVVGTVGLALALSSVVGLADGACTRTYRGDLVLEGSERLVITKGVLCVGGNIVLRDNARLEISNATLRMTSVPDGYWSGFVYGHVHDNAQLAITDSRVEIAGSRYAEFCLHTYDSSQATLRRVWPEAPAGLRVDARGSSRVLLEEIRLNEVGIWERAYMQVSDAPRIGKVNLVLTGAPRLELTDLRPMYYASWQFPSGSGTGSRLELQRVDVGAWCIWLSPRAHITLVDSRIAIIGLSPSEAWAEIDGVRPGHYPEWNLAAIVDAEILGSLTLRSTHVDWWSVAVDGRRSPLTLRDSHLLGIQVWDTSTRFALADTTLNVSEVGNSQLVLEGKQLTFAEGLRLDGSRLDITGSVRFGFPIERIDWTHSTVGRQYEVQVRGRDGQPARGVAVRVEDPLGRIITYTSDQDGVARFTIWFSDTTYDKTWHLLVPQGDTTARVPITLLTSTPVQVTAW